MTTRLRIQCVVYLILIVCKYNVCEDLTVSLNTTYKFCSSILSKVIDSLCNNTFRIVKRDTSILMEKMEPKSVQEQKSKHRLLAKERWRRVRRQVANECCNSPCSIGHIILYCPSGSKIVKENPDLFEE